MGESLEELVRSRAGDRCEYCRMPQAAIDLPFPVDHVIARQHLGPTEPNNLALACTRCNLFKGPNIAGLDPTGGVLTRLFSPRIDRWDEHFRISGSIVIGCTAIGRTTVQVLSMNQPTRVALRRALEAAGLFGTGGGPPVPPSGSGPSR